MNKEEMIAKLWKIYNSVSVGMKDYVIIFDDIVCTLNIEELENDILYVIGELEGEPNE
jgi:predicted phosphohydrolase